MHDLGNLGEFGEFNCRLTVQKFRIVSHLEFMTYLGLFKFQIGVAKILIDVLFFSVSCLDFINSCNLDFLSTSCLLLCELDKA